MSGYEFTVPGRPVAWQRPGSARNGRRFDTAQNQAAKAAIGMAARAAGVRPTEGPVILRVSFTFKRPKSHLNAKGELRKGKPKHHIYKPDTDNLTKLVKDGLNGIAYEDDAQVVMSRAAKFWTTDGESETRILVVHVDSEAQDQDNERQTA